MPFALLSVNGSRKKRKIHKASYKLCFSEILLFPLLGFLLFLFLCAIIVIPNADAMIASSSNSYLVSA